jgi:hypothetical protein
VFEECKKETKFRLNLAWKTSDGKKATWYIEGYLTGENAKTFKYNKKSVEGQGPVAPQLTLEEIKSKPIRPVTHNALVTADSYILRKTYKHALATAVNDTSSHTFELSKTHDLWSLNFENLELEGDVNITLEVMKGRKGCSFLGMEKNFYRDAINIDMNTTCV